MLLLLAIAGFAYQDSYVNSSSCAGTYNNGCGNITDGSLSSVIEISNTNVVKFNVNATFRNKTSNVTAYFKHGESTPIAGSLITNYWNNTAGAWYFLGAWNNPVNPPSATNSVKIPSDGIINGNETRVNGSLNVGQFSVAYLFEVWFNDTPIFPSVAIQSPSINATYNVSSIALNYTTISGTNAISTCFYSLDGTANQTLPNCANTTILAGNGNHNLTIFVNDTLGNINSSSVSFAMDVLLYIRALDEATQVPVTFNVTLTNVTTTKTYTNQGILTGNVSSDPFGVSVQAIISAAGYNTRTYYYSWYGTQKVNLTAYLPSSSSTYPYTFLVKNSQQLAVVSASVNVYKQIGGMWTLVAQGMTDSSGSVSFSLIPLTSSYQVVITATGYTQFTSIITPTLTEFTYQFVIGDSNIINFDTVMTNIRIDLVPSTLLVNPNGTINWTVYSSNNALEWYSLNLSTGFFQNTSTNFGGVISGSYTGFTNGNITAIAQFKKSGYPAYTLTRVYQWQNVTRANTTLAYLFQNITSDASVGVQGRAFFALAGTVAGVLVGGVAAGPVGSGIIGSAVLAMFGYYDWIDSTTVALTLLFIAGVAILVSREVW